jgi:hypothetical protein
MVGEATEPVVVSENQAVLDLLKALGRYVVVIVTIYPAISALLKSRDVFGLIAFFQSSEGAALAAAIVGIGTLLYGLYKTHFRAAQVVTVAQDNRVPAEVAQIHYK